MSTVAEEALDAVPNVSPENVVGLTLQTVISEIPERILGDPLRSVGGSTPGDSYRSVVDARHCLSVITRNT